MEKTKFREQVREYAEARRKASFDSLGDVQRSKEMTRFHADRALRIIDLTLGRAGSVNRCFRPGNEKRSYQCKFISDLECEAALSSKD